MEKTPGKQELYGRAYLPERHHRFPALSQRREEEEESADSRLAGGGRAVRTWLRRTVSTEGATLKYRPPPPPPPPSSLTALRPGQSVRQGGSGEEGDKAGEDERRSPLPGLIQSPIPSRLRSCLFIHEDDSAASPGVFVPWSTFDSTDPNSEIILRLLAASTIIKGADRSYFAVSTETPRNTNPGRFE